MKFEHLEKYLHGEAGEGLMIVAGIALLLLLIVAILIFDKVENLRFKHWCDRYGMTEPPVVPWRTIIPWHKTGSKWYQNHSDALSLDLHGKGDRLRYPQGKMSGNSFAIHSAKRGGGGSFGDGSGNSTGR